MCAHLVRARVRLRLRHRLRVRVRVVGAPVLLQLVVCREARGGDTDGHLGRDRVTVRVRVRVRVKVGQLGRNRVRLRVGDRARVRVRVRSGRATSSTSGAVHESSQSTSAASWPSSAKMQLSRKASPGQGWG